MDYASLIKSMVSTPELLAFYGFKRNRAGFICCPFHGEKTPSMKVYDGQRGFYCFGGCGEHGDIIDFVKKYFNLSFYDALEKINNDFCLGLPIKGGNEESRKKAQAEAKKRRQEKELINAHHERLKKAYYSASDEWAKLDRQKQLYAPKSAEEPPHSLFLEAIKNIETAAYRLDCAENELRLFENEKYGKR